MLYIILAIVLVIVLRKLCLKLMVFCSRKIDICIIRNNLSGGCYKGDGYCKKILNCRRYSVYKFFYHFCDFLESMIVYSLLPAISLYCAYEAYVTGETFAGGVFSLFTLTFITQMIKKIKEYRFDSERKHKTRIRVCLIGVFLYAFIIALVMSKLWIVIMYNKNKSSYLNSYFFVKKLEKNIK